MRAHFRPVGALVSVAVLALAACGPRLLGASATIGATTSEAVTPSAVPAVSTPHVAVATAMPTTRTLIVTRTVSATTKAATTTPGQTPVAVYFTQGGQLVTERRTVPAMEPARGSVDALLAGPETAGHYSQVPSGTQLLHLNLAGGTATVDFSSQAKNLEGSPAIPLFLGQVVDTLTQFADVQHVVIEVDGQALRSLGGEGATVPEPLDRTTVEKMLAGNG